MPHDGYHDHPGSYDAPGNINGMDYSNDPRYSYHHAPPYPSHYGQHGPDRINMPHPQMMPPTSSPSNQYPDPHRDSNSSSNSNDNKWDQQHHTGRINDAVNSAFSGAERPSYLSPEVLSQITANVIQQLKETGLDNIPGQPQQQQALGSRHGHSQSPPRGHEDTSNHQPNPPPNGYQGGFRPPSRPSPVSQPMERHGSRASQSSDPNPRTESRPSPVSSSGMTTLEKIWGRLFEDGRPTKRLGQFLRGIAIHLIEDYSPGNTLVVTTEKMQKFYEDTQVSSDYPWQDIFDDRTSAISRLLREVEAEHHLVQVKLNERPDVPGLTPKGFERWATLMIQAHPEREFERLQKAVLNMPISNPGDKRERFPKEIPRRLFPETPDLALREEVDRFIMRHCAVDLPPITEEEIAAAHRPKASLNPTVVDEEEEEEEEEKEEQEEAAPGPIERERKPYSAHPGGGKMYDGPGPSKQGHSRSFSTSTGPKESLIPPNAGRRGTELPHQDLPYARTGSATSHHPTASTGRSRSSSRGMHAGNEYRHSEGDTLGHNGGPRYSGAGDHYLNPGDVMEDARRYRDFERESEDRRLYESLRDRERDREKSKYHHHHDHLPPRGHWVGEEDYYRGAFGGGGGGPVGGNGGYDYYGYR